jgi:hypothetical protein
MGSSRDLSPAAADKAQKRAPNKRALILTIIGGILVVAIALGLGLGLGLKKPSDSSDDNGPTDNGPTEHNPAWKPAVKTTWQITLHAPIKLSRDQELTPDVEAYDTDLFLTDDGTIEELHRRGKKIICYFSAGSFENYRPDATDFPAQDLGSVMDGWPDEKWVNISSPKIRDIMAKRIKMASQKKCDAIDPDNVDGFVRTTRSQSGMVTSLLTKWASENSPTKMGSASQKTTRFRSSGSYPAKRTSTAWPQG